KRSSVNRKSFKVPMVDLMSMLHHRTGQTSFYDHSATARSVWRVNNVCLPRPMRRIAAPQWLAPGDVHIESAKCLTGATAQPDAACASLSELPGRPSCLTPPQPAASPHNPAATAGQRPCPAP